MSGWNKLASKDLEEMTGPGDIWSVPEEAAGMELSIKTQGQASGWSLSLMINTMAFGYDFWHNPFNKLFNYRLLIIMFPLNPWSGITWGLMCDCCWAMAYFSLIYKILSKAGIKWLKLHMFTLDSLGLCLPLPLDGFVILITFNIPELWLPHCISKWILQV